MIPMNDDGQRLGDAIAASAIGAAMLGWLPEIATILSIIWFGIRIWETETVRSLTGRLPKNKETKNDE